ncbi:MAG: helix-turn-helix domain-containing protein [Planctomycetota bacterium]
MGGKEPQYQAEARTTVQRSMPIDHVEPRPSTGGATSDAGSTDGLLTQVAGENRSLDEILASIERREILGALNRAHGQRTAAAQLLRISRSRLYRRMEALGINPRVSQSEKATA